MTNQRWTDRARTRMGSAWAGVKATLAQVAWDDLFGLVLEYQQLMPSNIRGRVAMLACLDERISTIPMAWVVPTEIVVRLLNLRDDPEAQLVVVRRHQEAILNQCELVLDGLAFPSADHTREAIACYRAGFSGPAQSHAANIFDSIVLAMFADSAPRKERRAARQIGGSPVPQGDEMTVRQVVNRLVLGPTVNAFAEWYPERQDPTPTHFARHTTAHAAHLPDVFGDETSLVSIMLATSLVVHYRDQLGAPGSFDPLRVPGTSLRLPETAVAVEPTPLASS